MTPLDFKLLTKDVKQDGTFEGLAAVYGNKDHGGDIIEPGAFTRTLKNSNGRVPILWQHDKREPIGAGYLSDSREGLKIRGELVMESDVARKALGLMKARVLNGLSIGYDAVKAQYDKVKDATLLKEIRLYEVSLVTFPMNPLALVGSVKTQIENVASSVKSLYEGIKSGREITPEMREELMRISEKIQALASLDSGNDSDEPPATQQLGDSDLHSLMDILKEIV
jgi:HK97 family phage prohead protease